MTQAFYVHMNNKKIKIKKKKKKVLGFELKSLHLEPLHQSFFVMDFF
jgi:predicted ATPase